MSSLIGNAEEIIKWLFSQDREKVFEITEHKEKRSANANRLLWECLGQLAVANNTDKWSIYLLMLKRYGKFTYVCIKPNTVESFKKQWRETEEIGEININGEKAVQMLCYFGSSTFNTKEFSYFLEGVISEMKEMGIPTPTDKEFDRAIKQFERTQNGRTKDNQRDV